VPSKHHNKHCHATDQTGCWQQLHVLQLLPVLSQQAAAIGRVHACCA
jgi:hypothetical protein